MDIAFNVFIYFCAWYIIVGAGLSLLPKYEGWLESQLQDALRSDPSMDEYILRIGTYVIFIVFWAFFWIDPLRSKKK